MTKGVKLALGFIVFAMLAALAVSWAVASSHHENTTREILTAAQPLDSVPEWNADGGECIVVDYGYNATKIIREWGYSTWERTKPEEMSKCRKWETTPRYFSGGLMSDMNACSMAPTNCAYFAPAYFTPPRCKTAGDLNDLTKDIMKRCCMYDLEGCQTWKGQEACKAKQCPETVLEVEKACREFLRNGGDTAKPAREGINAAILACQANQQY